MCSVSFLLINVKQTSKKKIMILYLLNFPTYKIGSNGYKHQCHHQSDIYLEIALNIAT